MSQHLEPYSVILGAALQYRSEELKVFKGIIGDPMTKAGPIGNELASHFRNVFDFLYISGFL